ncbi:HdeD family acid-resistance protein [Isobaculum melis]|uniref:Uncharacterized membrane protein HdeD, DUF308 family n=1 Tax=Isobaculum melis TaxID=142588 RepID=A0A1H9QFX0_9LACT|nr:DUF308 domain-containing protein [Isobaculum melis]SER59300.1 Uncharacterized membrane protein HdeD, DUF308 family [Isobaculum melis]
MSLKQINQLHFFITGFGLIFFGVFILVAQLKVLSMMAILIILAFLLDGLSQWFQFFIQKKQEKRLLLDGLIKIILGTISYYNSDLPIDILFMAFGGYTFVKGFAKLMNYTSYRDNQIPMRLPILITSLFLMLAGISLLFSPMLSNQQMMLIFSLYFIFYGLGNLGSGIASLFTSPTADRFKRKIRITLPVFIEAFIPRMVLHETNELLKPQDKQEEEFPLMQQKIEEQPDLEIFIHVTEKGFGSVGHMDLYFEGELISYGNYDESSYHFFDSMGDGVLVAADKEQYIPFCIAHNKKTLFGFGLKLTEEQILGIREKVQALKQTCYPWKSALQLAEEQHLPIDLAEYPDYASCLYHATGCDLFKFKQGRFKSYFVLTTNCVLLADHLIGPSGIDLLTINGILTPGTYLNFLRREFKREDSNVISYHIYN